MALQTANNFQLTPDIGGAVSRGINTGINIQQQNQRTDLLGEQKTQRTAQQEKQAQTDMLQGAANAAVKAQNLPDDISRVNFLKQRVQEVSGRGGDASDTMEVLGLFESGQSEQANALLKSFVDTSIQTGLINAAPQSKSTSFTLGSGQKRFDEQGNVIATGGDAPIKLSSLQQKVADEGIDPNTVEGQARAREITQGSRTDPSLKPSDQQILNKANEGQLASASFATRVLSANENLTSLENTPGFDPTSIQTAIFESLPGGNLALSEQEQSYAQSKRDFITAILRKESGAAIGADEFANEDRKFFPQVGDKPAVLKQKALGRKRTFENLKNQSKGVFDVQNKSGSGPLSKTEQSELQQLRQELGL